MLVAVFSLQRVQSVLQCMALWLLFPWVWWLVTLSKVNSYSGQWCYLFGHFAHCSVLLWVPMLRKNVLRERADDPAGPKAALSLITFWNTQPAFFQGVLPWYFWRDSSSDRRFPCAWTRLRFPLRGCCVVLFALSKCIYNIYFIDLYCRRLLKFPFLWWHSYFLALLLKTFHFEMISNLQCSWKNILRDLIPIYIFTRFIYPWSSIVFFS